MIAAAAMFGGEVSGEAMTAGAVMAGEVIEATPGGSCKLVDSPPRYMEESV